MDSYEQLLMSIVLFFGAIPIIGVLLSFVNAHIWWLTLLISLVLSLVISYLVYGRPKLAKPTVHLILALLVVACFFFVFYKGTFSYPWLEDHDPYGYAVSTAYINEQHTFIKPVDVLQKSYLEPYPVGLSIFMSSFLPITGDMNWTLKFFNVILATIAILGSYFFFKEFFKDESKALVGCLFIAVLPSFMTHFIFSTTLGMALLFPTLYFLWLSKEKPHACLATILLMASILVTHTLAGLIILIFTISYLICNRNAVTLTSLLGGLILAIPFWVYVFLKYTWEGIKFNYGLSEAEGIVGTATRPYNVIDFLNAPSQNLINTSTGWGVAFFCLVLIGIVAYFYLKKYKENQYVLISIWFIIALVGVNAARLPFMLMPFRWWTPLAIPATILAIEGVFLVKKYSRILFYISIFCVILTSGGPKYLINTSQWMPSESLMYPGIMDCHLWAKDHLPLNTKIYSFNQGPKLFGFNMYYCEWCSEEKILSDQFLDTKPFAINKFLKNNGYKHLIINSWYFDKFGEGTANKTQEILDSKMFSPIYSNQGCVILEVK